MEIAVWIPAAKKAIIIIQLGPLSRFQDYTQFLITILSRDYFFRVFIFSLNNCLHWELRLRKQGQGNFKTPHHKLYAYIIFSSSSNNENNPYK